jgi:hypothetical protein
MDMSNFHRKKRTGSPPDLSALLAQVSARQAVSPTARVATQTAFDARLTSDMAPEMAPFAQSRAATAPPSARASSFNRKVAADLLPLLLTPGKGS